MSRYYCPYCYQRNLSQKISSNGVLICGQCGDPLIKTYLINSRRIIGVVAATAFLTPLLVMIIFVVNNFTGNKLPNNSESLVLLTIH